MSQSSTLPHGWPGLWLAGLLAGIALSPACSKPQDAIAGAAPKHAKHRDVTLQRHALSMRIEDRDEEIKVANPEEGGPVPLPANFPEDVFLPSRRAVNSTMDIGDMKMVNITTPSLPPAVSADVEQAMLAHGWKREMAMQADGSSTLIYTKAGRQAVYQMMKADSGGTQVAVRTGGG